MPVPARRMTFRLHLPTLEGIDALVRSGVAPSRNVLIETLVDQAVRVLRRRERESEAEKIYAQAFRDPAYVAEQEQLSRAYGAADAEAARAIG